MATDYKKQYEPHQLEPFWPNEMIKMIVSVLCTMVVIMLLAVLPVLLSMGGLEHVLHAEEPANPGGGTPVGIKPEWYFLAVYQWLKIWPAEMLGISGKTLGVLSQGPLILLIVLLPFLYRRAAGRPISRAWWWGVTSVVMGALAFTIWGAWPELEGGGGLISFGKFFAKDPLFFIFIVAAVFIFYGLMAHERRLIQRVLGDRRKPIETDPHDPVEPPEDLSSRDPGPADSLADQPQGEELAGDKQPPLTAAMRDGVSSLRALLPFLLLLGALTARAGGGPLEQAGDDPFADNNCVQCHVNLPGRPSEIVELEWKQSVHYAANVGCNGCHGGNPALRREQFDSEEAFKRAAHLERHPDFLFADRGGEFVSAARGRSVSYFCGKCHSTIKEKHLGSPHGDFGDPSCLYCHGGGSHLITRPSAEIIDTRSRSEGGRCAACHRAGTMESVRRIRETLIDTEEQIAHSTQLSEDLSRWGYRDLSLEQLHQHAAEINSRLRQVFHSFNMMEINNFAGEIRDGVERIEETHAMIAQLRQVQQRQALVGLAGATWLLGFAGLLMYYKKRFCTPHGQGKEAARK